ncbi:MAG: hypothetical protein K2I70_05245, partial [Bacilli bacterium]|nr:hypothetical protein [Bacilli bacterium]
DLKSLSILEIYALEEVLRYGTKKVYDRFLEAKGLMDDDVAAKNYDEFVKLMSEDEAFMQYKREQVLYSPETLSPIEMLAFEVVGMPEEEKRQEENIGEEEKDTKEDAPLEYDPLNPIRSATENQIRETLENLVFGEYIFRVLEHPAMWEIRGRCDGGKIASVDKPFIIEKIKVQTSSDEFPNQLKNLVDSRYLRVKMALLLGKSQEEAFAEYLPYNTNISVYEILGIERDNTEEEMLQYFKDLINNRKGNGPKM